MFEAAPGIEVESPQPRPDLGLVLGFLMRGEDLERKARPARGIIMLWFCKNHLPLAGAPLFIFRFLLGLCALNAMFTANL